MIFDILISKIFLLGPVQVWRIRIGIEILYRIFLNNFNPIFQSGSKYFNPKWKKRIEILDLDEIRIENFQSRLKYRIEILNLD